MDQSSKNLSPRQIAVLTARRVVDKLPIYLDTETTGVGAPAEIVEIGMIDHDGETLIESLVRPKNQIPSDAIAIHNITNEMVKNSKPWPIIWPTVRGLVLNRVIAAYNADFDYRMLQNSLTIYGLPWKDNLNMFCIMKLFAQFIGEWNPRRGSYRYFSLEEAGRMCRLSLPNAHRAVADTLLSRDLLLFIAGSNP